MSQQQTNKIIQTEPTKESVRGAIQYDCYHSKLTIRQIAEKYHVTPVTVMKWKKRKFITDKPRNRISKLKPKHIEYIKKIADGKFTGIDQASSRMIAYNLQRKFNRNLKKMVLILFFGQINKALDFLKTLDFMKAK